MADKCSCPIRPNMTYDELRSEILSAGKMCTTNWICSTLDAELRRADKERQRQEQYSKRQKKAGKVSGTRKMKSGVPENFQPRKRNV